MNDFLSSTAKTPCYESLPLLEAIYARIQKLPNLPDFHNILFVCGQHLLATTVNLFEVLIRLGAQPQNIFIVGKSYSNHQRSIQILKDWNIQVQPNAKQVGLGNFVKTYEADIVKMWHTAFEKLNGVSQEGKSFSGLMIIDDGGHVLNHVTDDVLNLCHNGENYLPIVGIEQTSSGIFFTEDVPYSIIELATCAAKSWFEPEWVANKMMNELEIRLKPLKNDTPSFETMIFGVVGLGHLGFQVLKCLVDRGCQNIIVFDIEPDKRKMAIGYGREKGLNVLGVDQISQVLHGADCIIGCTGKDITANVMDEFKIIRIPKILVSGSSKDMEFRSLLRHIQRNNRGYFNTPLQDLVYQNTFGVPIHILRGGCPINFNNGAHSVDPEKIQLIRGLMLEAILQAYEMLQKKNGNAKNYMLNPERQQAVISEFLKIQDPTGDFKNNQRLIDIDSIIQNSGGILQPEA